MVKQNVCKKEIKLSKIGQVLLFEVLHPVGLSEAPNYVSARLC